MSFRPRSQAATFPFHASNTSFDNRTGKFNGHKTAMSLTALMLAFFSTAFLSPTSAQEKTAKPSSEAVEESFKTVDSLKVTKILFYSSGVAQIIHAGQISGNIEIELGFAANDIDDALKSLVLEDPDGDSQVVVYPTAPSAEQMAADEFADPLTLAQTFQLFRGEELCFKYNDAERTGTIYVVENRQQDDVVVETLVILSESGLQAYPVAELSEIRFMDDATSKKFRDALTGLRLDRNPTDIKKVFLQFKGKGKRDVRYSYLIDGPIWRITYRLMLEGEKANLQSWVHLDNIFGYDWEDVEVELRNGQPDAFHVDLFAPIVAQRRDAGLSAFELPKNVSLVSRWYELSSPLRFGGGQQPDDSDKGAGGAMGGMGGGGTFGGGGGMGGMGGGFGGGAGLGRGGGLGGASGGNEPATGSGGTGRVRPLLGTDQNPERLLDPRQVAIAGDSQFQIHGAVVLKLKNRVSLSAGSSAVVPVFVQEFPVRKLTRVSFADAPEKEVATLIGGSATQIGGLQLEINNVGKTPLLTGPIAIFEQGSFIGDGLLKRTFSNEKLLVDYGADLETVVSQAYTEPITGPVEITLEERTIKVRLETRQTLTLDITNQHPEPRTLRLKLPDSLQDESRWTRLEPPLDFVDGETEMEFEVPAQETLARKHILILEEFETFNPAEAVPQYKTWKNLKLKIPPDVKKLLEETVEAHRRYREKQELVQALKDTARALELEQIRLSRLVEIAKSDPELAKTFLNSIRDAEKEMIETRKKIKLEEVQLRKLEVEWKTYS